MVVGSIPTGATIARSTCYGRATPAAGLTARNPMAKGFHKPSDDDRDAPRDDQPRRDDQPQREERPPRRDDERGDERDDRPRPNPRIGRGYGNRHNEQSQPRDSHPPRDRDERWNDRRDFDRPPPRNNYSEERRFDERPRDDRGPRDERYDRGAARDRFDDRRRDNYNDRPRYDDRRRGGYDDRGRFDDRRPPYNDRREPRDWRRDDYDGPRRDYRDERPRYDDWRGDDRRRYDDRRDYRDDRPRYDDRRRDNFRRDDYRRDDRWRGNDRRPSQGRNDYRRNDSSRSRSDDKPSRSREWRDQAKQQNPRQEKDKRRFKPPAPPNLDPSKLNEPIRLNKFLARSTSYSRRDSDELIKRGRVTVNGEVMAPGFMVNPGDVVLLDEKPVNRRDHLVYILLNKPKDVALSTVPTEGEAGSLGDLLKFDGVEQLKAVHPLEQEMLGLQLLSNDDAIAKHFVEHPPKETYTVLLEEPGSEELLLELAPEDTKAKGKILVAEYADEEHLRLTLVTRGGYPAEEVAAAGLSPSRIDRLHFAGLTKKDLPRGHWRFLNDREVTWVTKFQQ